MGGTSGKRVGYGEKFERFRRSAGVDRLHAAHRAFVRRAAFEHRFTFQELRRVCEIARDFELWGVTDLESRWESCRRSVSLGGRELKKHLLGELERRVADLARGPVRYDSNAAVEGPPRRARKPVITRETDKSIWGMCPVASERTVCCNLRTIDAVENCVFGCSYCTVQTFYSDEVVFDADFARKLKSIEIEPDRFYHFGTGQASDSLVWGNRNGVLDALVGWAADHPNVLLEFKTKSKNIGYFVDRGAPANVVCSWSLQTPVVIEHEEHFTATLDERIEAAREVADRGVAVAFHFHPMVYYEGWARDYPTVAKTLQSRFAPEEVRFVSFGSVTLIKPVIRKIRELGNPTSINRGAFASDPHGKLTYDDDTKVEMFGTMHEAFAPWRECVFLYLCMEKRSIWQRSFGYVYQSNREFEIAFGQRTLRHEESAPFPSSRTSTPKPGARV